jgi:CubicO group peptidase (beta-lactamase class C family)
MRILKVILFLFVCYYSNGIAQTIHDSLPGKRLSYLTDNKMITGLDSLVERTVVDFMQSPQNCGLSIGIIKDSATYFYNYGETKRNNKNLPDKNSIYEIGSISKTFCGIILAYAVGEGKIKLEDDIRKYLPEHYSNLEMNKQFIQIKHLANHTSGLPRLPDNLKEQPDFNILNPYKNYTKSMAFEFLQTVKLAHEPGDVCEYSNFGMALLGMILEKVYGKSFEEIIKEKICHPNNMNSTLVNLNQEQLKLLTDGHNVAGLSTPHWDLGSLVSAGGIKSTTSDMINYMRYNINEFDAAVKLSHRSTYSNGSNVALAWHIIKTKLGNELVWHNGATFGYSSFCGFIKEKKCALVVLSNSSTNVDQIGISIFKILQK